MTTNDARLERLRGIIREHYTLVETSSFINGKASPYNILNNKSPIERCQTRKISYGIIDLESFIESSMVQKFIEEEYDRKNFKAKLIGLHWGLLHWNPEYMNYDEFYLLKSLKIPNKKISFHDKEEFDFLSLLSEKVKKNVDIDGLFYNLSKRNLKKKLHNSLNYLTDTDSLRKDIDRWIENGLDPKEELKKLRKHIVRLYFSLVKYHDYIPRSLSIE